ncbi:MAG: hypothetical protein HYS23_04540 [Geobacter sp.]|nr:hypothetical protein [Geobacter sp.]
MKLSPYFIVVLSLLLTPLSAVAGTTSWLKVGDSYISSTFLDTTTVTNAYNGKVRYRTMTVPVMEGAIDEEFHHDHIDKVIAENEVDCPHRKVQQLSLDIFTNDGRHMAEADDDNHSHDGERRISWLVDPDTYDATIYTVVCHADVTP